MLSKSLNDITKMVDGMKMVLVILFFTFSNPLFSQKEYGYFIFDSIKESVPGYVSIQNEKDEVHLRYLDTLKSMESDLFRFVQGIPHSMSEKQRRKHEDSLRYYQNHLEEYSELAQEKYKQFVTEKDNRLFELTNQYLIEFCIQNGIDMITEKKKLLYCNSCIDYSEAFKTYLVSKHL